jgi:hypothetical protein
MGIKPKLARQITVADFKSHYWLKAELLGFCKANALSMAGSKQEIAERIEVFITTGNKTKPELVKKIVRDSHQTIKTNTPVEHYNNDAATRQFFISQLREHFHFNSYLRQFTNKNNITSGLTYGDLVTGWLAEESKRNDPQYKTRIDKQFEYNQFVRDFFANEKGKSQPDVVKAWKAVKTFSGAKTYANYRSTLKREKS